MDINEIRQFYTLCSEVRSTPMQREKFCLDTLKPILDYVIQAHDLLQKQSETKSGYNETNKKVPKRSAKRK